MIRWNPRELWSHLNWQITARNWMGWPTERRHRITGRVQHIRYNKSGKWTDGPLQQEGGPHAL